MKTLIVEVETRGGHYGTTQPYYGTRASWGSMRKTDYDEKYASPLRKDNTVDITAFGDRSVSFFLIFATKFQIPGYGILKWVKQKRARIKMKLIPSLHSALVDAWLEMRKLEAGSELHQQGLQGNFQSDPVPLRKIVEPNS
jgi:hypothetical protein